MHLCATWRYTQAVANNIICQARNKTGPHIYETSPTGQYYEHKAQGIGSRSQSARTYLEKVYTTFEGLSVDELVVHVIKSLEGAAGEKDLTAKNVGITIVGEGQDVKILSEEELQTYLAVAFEGKTDENADEGGEEATKTEDVTMEES